MRWSSRTDWALPTGATKEAYTNAKKALAQQSATGWTLMEGAVQDFLNLNAPGWCPGVFKSNHRTNANFQAAQLIGVDFDDIHDLDEINFHPLVVEFAVAVGLTPGHGLPFNPTPRARAIFVLDKVVSDFFDYRQIVVTLMREMTIMDSSCKDPARFFFGCQKWLWTNPDARLPLREVAEWKAEHDDQDAHNTPDEPIPDVAPGKSACADSAQAAYVEKGWDNELQALERAQEGERNSQLFKTACALYSFVKAGSEDKPTADYALQRAALSIGLGDKEIIRTLESAWSSAEARDLSQVGQGDTVVTDIPTRFDIQTESATVDGKEMTEVTVTTPPQPQVTRPKNWVRPPKAVTAPFVAPVVISGGVNTERTPGFDPLPVAPPGDTIDPSTAQVPIVSTPKITQTEKEWFQAKLQNPGTGGLTTNLQQLDRFVGDWVRGRYYTLFALENRGKSTLAVTLAAGWSKQAPGIVLTTETAPKLWYWKLIAYKSQVNIASILEGRTDAAETKRVLRNVEEIATRQIYYVDSHRPNIYAIDENIRASYQQMGYQWFLCDSISNVHTRGSDAIYERTSRASNVLQELARDTNLITFATTQVSYDGRKQDNGIAQANQAYGGSVIGHDSDVCMSLNYPYGSVLMGLTDEDTHDHAQWPPGKTEVRITKHRWRGIPSGSVKLHFNGGIGFSDWTRP